MMEQANEQLAPLLGKIQKIVPALQITDSLLDRVRELGMQEQDSEELSRALLALTRELLFLEAMLRNIAKQAMVANCGQTDIVLQ